MNRQYNTLDDHIQLLEKKGFTEEVLDMKSKPGTIATQLRKVYKEVTPDAFRSGESESFTLIIPARFDLGQDRVDFRLNYRFNPLDNQLKISSLTANMGDAKKLILLTNQNQLKSAPQIYQDLAEIRMKKVISLLANRKVNPIKKTKHL